MLSAKCIGISFSGIADMNGHCKLVLESESTLRPEMTDKYWKLSHHGWTETEWKKPSTKGWTFQHVNANKTKRIGFCFHGLGGTAESMRGKALCKALGERVDTLIVPTMVGLHGGSPEAVVPLVMWRVQEKGGAFNEMIALVLELSTDYDEIFLTGFSFGAIISIAIANAAIAMRGQIAESGKPEILTYVDSANLTKLEKMNGEVKGVACVNPPLYYAPYEAQRDDKTALSLTRNCAKVIGTSFHTVSFGMVPQVGNPPPITLALQEDFKRNIVNAFPPDFMLIFQSKEDGWTTHKTMQEHLNSDGKLQLIELKTEDHANEESKAATHNHWDRTFVTRTIKDWLKKKVAGNSSE